MPEGSVVVPPGQQASRTLLVETAPHGDDRSMDVTPAVEAGGEAQEELSGAQALIRALVAEGVEVVFGYPGGAILPVYDVLFRTEAPAHVLVRHEQGAAHMAEGYARATGRAGVCLVTSGPGATNLVTGLASAYMDSVPVVAITGQVPTGVIGRDAFQEADVCGITMPITKHNYQVRDAAEIPRTVHEAFHLAQSGRPGPVLIDVPKDVANARCRFGPFPPALDLPGYRPTLEGHRRQIEEACRLINAAERPLLYVGGGCVAAGAHEAVRAIAEKAHVPVVMTLMGLGTMPGRHPLSLGMLGMHGSVAANRAVQGADLLIAVGVRFDDRVTGDVRTFAARARKIHVDVDPAEIGKNVPVDVPIVGDALRVLEAMAGGIVPARHEAWWQQIRAWQSEFPMAYERREGVIAPQDVVVVLDELTGGEAVIVTDVGQHQMWAAQFYRFGAPRRSITSGGLGAMGFGLPAAVGAAMGVKDRRVVALVGDGGILMTVQELATAAQVGRPLPIIVLNNFSLGMVRQWQSMFYGERLSESLLPRTTDLVQVAAGFGVRGRRVNRPDELRQAVAEALESDGPYLLDVWVDPEAKVLPMVPPGAGLDRMIGVKGRLE